MQDEWKKFEVWITSPFNTQMPLWALFVVFAVFVVIAYVVYDNLDIIKKSLAAPAKAVAGA